MGPDKREQTEMIGESIFTAARKQKGFRGVSFCLDPKGEAVFLSLWESKEALLANEDSGYYQEQVAKLKDVLTKPTTRHVAEVKAQEETHKTPKAARLTISGIRKDAEAQAIRLAQDVARAARNEPGFVAWYGALTEDSKMAAISFWDSDDAMRKSESRYLKDALGKLKEISTGEAQPKPYEVVEHDIPAGAGTSGRHSDANAATNTCSDSCATPEANSQAGDSRAGRRHPDTSSTSRGHVRRPE